MSQARRAEKPPPPPPPTRGGSDWDARMAGLEGQIQYLATKEDLQKVKLEIKDDVQGVEKGLKGDIQGVEKGLKGDIQGVEKGLKGDIQDVKLEVQKVRGEIKDVKIWMLGGVIAGSVSGAVVIIGLARIAEGWFG